jgi:hypothetical protein
MASETLHRDEAVKGHVVALRVLRCGQDDGIWQYAVVEPWFFVRVGAEAIARGAELEVLRFAA